MSTYTKIKTLPLSLFNNAEYLSFMNHVLDLANGNSGGGDSESPDEISLLTGSDGIPELGLTKEFLDTYEADLLAMADVVDESRTSQETEQMTLHDTNRDNLAIYIITRISRAGTLPLEAERDAGKYLYKVIKPYNGIARLPMAQETAKIKGLLLDCARTRTSRTSPRSASTLTSPSWRKRITPTTACRSNASKTGPPPKRKAAPTCASGSTCIMTISPCWPSPMA